MDMVRLYCWRRHIIFWRRFGACEIGCLKIVSRGFWSYLTIGPTLRQHRQLPNILLPLGRSCLSSAWDEHDGEGVCCWLCLLEESCANTIIWHINFLECYRDFWVEVLQLWCLCYFIFNFIKYHLFCSGPAKFTGVISGLSLSGAHASLRRGMYCAMKLHIPRKR